MNDIISDDELIAAARVGDDRAFALLVDRYESVVAATVIGMLGPGDEADDVGQETFIRFHRALDAFRGESSLKTYLVHIAMNLSLNALKRQRRSLLRFVRGEETVNAIPRSVRDRTIVSSRARRVNGFAARCCSWRSIIAP